MSSVDYQGILTTILRFLASGLIEFKMDVFSWRESVLADNI